MFGTIRSRSPTKCRYSSSRDSSAATIIHSRWLKCGIRRALLAPAHDLDRDGSGRAAGGRGAGPGAASPAPAWPGSGRPAGPRAARSGRAPRRTASALVAIRPVTSETAIPRRAAFADGGQGALADDQVLADERAVDVEGDQADRENRLGHQRAPATGRCRPRSTCASRGLPERSGWISARPARRQRRPLPASTAGPWSKPISRSAAPPGAERRGQRGEQPPDDGQSVGPAVERQTRLEGCGDGQPIDLRRRGCRAGWPG